MPALFPRKEIQVCAYKSNPTSPAMTVLLLHGGRIATAIAVPTDSLLVHDLKVGISATSFCFPSWNGKSDLI